jgi:hypothetical protein
MTRDYMRSLGPRLVTYFERLATSAPDRWVPHLSIARAFDALVNERPSSLDAKSLLARARELGDDGTAWQELLLALEALSSRR